MLPGRATGQVRTARFLHSLLHREVGTVMIHIIMALLGLVMGNSLARNREEIIQSLSSSSGCKWLWPQHRNEALKMRCFNNTFSFTFKKTHSWTCYFHDRTDIPCFRFHWTEFPGLPGVTNLDTHRIASRSVRSSRLGAAVPASASPSLWPPVTSAQTHICTLDVCLKAHVLQDVGGDEHWLGTSEE